MGGVSEALEFKVIEYTGIDGKTRQLVGDILDTGDTIRVLTSNGEVEIIKSNTVEVRKFTSIPSRNFFGTMVPRG